MKKSMQHFTANLRRTIGRIAGMKYALPVGIVLAGVVALLWFQVTAESPEPLRATSRAPAVAVQVVKKTTASPTLRVFGQVESPSMSVLTAGIEADVLEVKVLEGNTVRRGDELILLDDTDAKLDELQRRAELAEVEAMMQSDRIKLAADKDALNAEEALLALARKGVERARRLAQSEAGSEAAHDLAKQEEQRHLLAVTQRRQTVDDFASRESQLKARRDKAAAALQRAERERARTRVTAPFDGRITEVSVSPGDRAKRDSRLIQLYDESQLELRVQVPHGYIAALQRALDDGREVSASVASPAGRDGEMQLTLHRLSANVAAGQGGIDGFFRASVLGGRLPVPGGTLEITVKLPPVGDVVLLPADAFYGGGARIYIVQDGVLAARTVRRLGQLRDAELGQMLMVAGDGLTGGELVLISRLPQAVNGLPVRVVE